MDVKAVDYYNHWPFVRTEQDFETVATVRDLRQSRPCALLVSLEGQKTNSASGANRSWRPDRRQAASRSSASAAETDHGYHDP